MYSVRRLAHLTIFIWPGPRRPWFGIVLDDWIRYWIFKEELPHYKII